MSKFSASSSKPPVIVLANIDLHMAGFETMISFIEANGGRYSDYINPNVTHIVCSSVYFKENGPLLRQAKHWPHIKAVNWEWLETSLLEKRWKLIDRYEHRKPLEGKDDKDAYMDNFEKRLIAERAERAECRHTKVHVQTHAEIQEMFCDMALNEKHLGTPGYPTAKYGRGLRYEAKIIKMDAAGYFQADILLRMCESPTVPKYYGVYAITRNWNRVLTKSEVLAHSVTQFYQAVLMFMEYFYQVTGVTWPHRDVLGRVDGVIHC